MKMKKTLALFGILLFGTLFLVLSVVVLLRSHNSIYYTVAATLPNELKAAKQEGLPLTVADITPPHVADNARNAAILYSQIRLNDLNDQEFKSMNAVTKGLATIADYSTTKRLLSAAAPQLHLAEQAVLRPDCDFNRKWNLGPDLPIPEYKIMRRTARLLAVKATLFSDEGQPEAALSTLGVIARMSHDVGEDPNMIALLVQIALDAIMDRTFQRILKKYPNNLDILHLAARADEMVGEKPDLKRAESGEFVMCRIMAENVRKNGVNISDEDTVDIPLGVSQSTFANASEVRCISYWRRIFTALKHSSNASDLMAVYRAYKVIDDEEEAIAMTKDGPLIPFYGKLHGHLKPTYELNVYLSPFFTNAPLKLVALEARRRLRRTLLAILTYRLKNGHFPETLSQLSPVAPLDPFVSKPLLYRRTAKGFILYSVGENLIDDGGDATPKKKDDQLPDMVVTFP